MSTIDILFLVASGEAILLGTVGLFNRPVYQIGDKIYRQFIRWDGKDYVPGEYYEVRNQQAVLSILVKGR